MAGNFPFEKAPLVEYILNHKLKDSLLLNFDEQNGTVTYNPQAVNIDPNAPDFTGSKTSLNNEEYVRIVFLLSLASDYNYPLSNKYIDIEKVYEAPGRPKKGAKGSRADIIVRDTNGAPFLFFEIKTPKEYITEKANIKTQGKPQYPAGQCPSSPAEGFPSGLQFRVVKISPRISDPLRVYRKYRRHSGSIGATVQDPGKAGAAQAKHVL